MDKIRQKIISVVAALSLLFNSFIPLAVSSIYAQEASPAAELIDSSPQPSPIPEPSPSTSTSPEPQSESSSSAQVSTQPSEPQTPTPEPTPSPTPQPLWTQTDGGYTTQTLQLGVTYKFPPNEKVSLTFTKLPEGSGTVTVKEIKLTEEQVKETGALSDIAYEITSTMQDSTFEYTLTLPTPATQNVEVKTSEDGQQFVAVDGESVSGDVITISGLTHFTIFVVVGTIEEGDEQSQGVPFDESESNVLINEFVYNASTEWVELYNRSNQAVDLIGWKLEDGNNITSDDLNLSGTILSGGLLVFQRSQGWLNNTSSNGDGDTIFLKNNLGQIVNQVTYRRDAEDTVVDAQDLGSNPFTGDSIGREEDGSDTWRIFEDGNDEPTKGFNNDSVDTGEITFLNVGSIYPFSSIFEGLNGTGDLSGISSGGTINVAEGDYQETLVIGQSLTLRGAGIGNSTIFDGDCNGDPTVSIDADNVTLRDFTIDNDGCGGSVVRVGSGITGTIIRGNELINGNLGVEANGVSDANLTITDNTITNNDSTGIYLSGGDGDDGSSVSNSSVTISGNTVSNNDSDGIYINIVTDSIIDILGNTVSSNSNSGIYLCAEGECTDSTLNINDNSVSENGFNGVSVYSIFGSTVSVDGNEILSNSETGLYFSYIGVIEIPPDPSTVTVSNNTISSNGSYGIYIWSVDEVSEVTIGSDNTVSSNSSSGIYLDSQATGVEITGNIITNNGSGGGGGFTGIVVTNAQGNEAHQNIISGNNVGVQNDDPENNFDATENFWGSILGPLHEILNPGGGGDSVSDNVLFVPWYLTDALTNLDSTNPIITFSMPLPGITLPSSTPVIATTNETATCTYSLDGAEFSAMDTTGATSHIKDLSGLGAGSHSIKLTCTDSSGNSSTSSAINWTVIDFNNIESDLIFDSATDGQADLPDGITTLTLSNNTNFDVSSGLDTASGNNITIGGVVFDLSNFTNGDVTGYDFSAPQIVGGISFEIEKAVALQSGTNGEPILLTNSDLSGVNVFLPDGVSVLAPNGWSGTIQPPKTGSSSGSAPSGFSIGSTVIEVGSSDIVLLFDSPVTVILTGVTGPVGYKAAGSTTWTQITNTCGGTYASPTSPTFPGECAISNGTDTKIVTYHFTSFAALNTVSSTSSSSTQPLSAASGSVAAPTCNDTKPGSAPRLLNAVSGVNNVTLNWSKAQNPVTYYLVNYSLTPGKFQFGNPNVGGADTTSYQVQGLSGGNTYYFKVRAGNGCAPGDYSNELAATPTGGFVSTPAAGFAAGVLGAKTKVAEQKVTTTPTSTPQPQTIDIQLEQPQVSGDNLFSRILGFISSLFKGLFGR